MSKVSPTTKAQVSGHKFLVRRTELGLLCGDVRMIHDPIAKRLRATGFGVAAVVLIAVGSAALALFAPAHDPGDARIMRSDIGQYYVRDEETLYPTVNLLSARLIAGEPAEPAKISDAVLERYHLAQSVGIPDAPTVLAEVEQPLVWEVCTDERPKAHADPTPPVVEFAVSKETASHNLSGQQAILAQTDTAEWVVQYDSRVQLPAADTAEGRLMRRRLEITADTPRWRPSMDILQIIPEAPAWRLPQEGTVLTHDQEHWLLQGERVQKLTALQAAMLRDSGLATQRLRPAEIHELEDASPPLHLPPEQFQWVETAITCVRASATEPPSLELPAADASTISVGVMDELAPRTLGAKTLHGESHVTHYRGIGTSVAVATGNGLHLLSESGTRHVTSIEDAQAIGVQHVHAIPWLMLRLLPEGTKLSAEQAQQPVFGR